jgi:pyruvate,water dikinase
LAVEARRGSLPRLSVAAARLYLEEKRLTEALTRYERDAEQRRRWLSEMDLAILPDDALVTTLREIHGVVSITGKLLLESSIAALAAHTSFQALIARFSPEMPARLAQSLSAGNVELESARAATALAHVVEILRSDAAARGVLGSARGAHDLPPGPGRRALESWLEAFGDRGHDELELASPRWEEQLAPVLAMMRAGVRAPAADPEQKLSGVRVDADRELAQLETRASAVERVLVRTLLARTRGLARLRERMRVWMAKVTAMTRRVVLDVDRRMRRLDAGLVPGSAFFLTEHELCSAAGRTRADLGALVRMRRATFDRDAASPDPPDTFAGEPPRLVAPAFDPRIVHGAPASGGIVTGKVRVLGPRGRHAEHVESGEVLVVRTPDIGLAPLFFWVGALVSDSGSALSHAAVVAREVGIPAVLGTLDASTTLRDGELVRVDGDRGVVERLDG